jgi:hypothetical protein
MSAVCLTLTIKNHTQKCDSQTKTQQQKIKSKKANNKGHHHHIFKHSLGDETLCDRE